MHVVIFTGGEFTKSNLTEKVVKEADMILAADSGAEYAVKLDIYPAAVLGDLDSISSKTKDLLKKHGTQFVSMPTTLLSHANNRNFDNASEKDQTDTELAVRYALEQGATKITILGGNAGDRFDHVMANTLLATAIDVPMQFVNGNQVSWIEKGPATVPLSGKKGDLLSLIPLSQEVTGITTSNLYYPLKRETLLFGLPRGVSNVMKGKNASVRLKKGIVLIVVTIL